MNQSEPEGVSENRVILLPEGRLCQRNIVALWSVERHFIRTESVGRATRYATFDAELARPISPVSAFGLSRRKIMGYFVIP